jgi:hypothetical protein
VVDSSGALIPLTRRAFTQEVEADVELDINRVAVAVTVYLARRTKRKCGSSAVRPGDLKYPGD